MEEKIQELLRKEHILEQRLSSMVFGAPEVRDGDKLYVHFRDGGRQETRYVGKYAEETHNLILKNNQTAKELKKELRAVRHELNELGYTRRELSEKVKRNLDFAKRNLALTIHSQAILEGVATTFADTEVIIAGGRVGGMTEQDIRKIVNMKHAWEFILDSDVITAPDNLALVCQINRLVEEGFYFNAGKLRDVPVNIGGTTWRPDLPIESQIVEEISDILGGDDADLDKAINLTLFVMKTQIFIDGNKRTAIIFANHFLISRGLGIIYIPEEATEEFKRLLVAFYETDEKSEISAFLKKRCYLGL